MNNNSPHSSSAKYTILQCETNKSENSCLYLITFEEQQILVTESLDVDVLHEEATLDWEIQKPTQNSQQQQEVTLTCGWSVSASVLLFYVQNLNLSDPCKF